MRQEKKQKDKPAIALVLCFCLMALVSVFVVKANIDKVKDNMEGNKTADVVKPKAVDEKSETSTGIVDSRAGENQENPTSATRFIVPVSGEIIMDYSMDMPIYWVTLDQYMTHSGVDIAAPVSTGVKACASGTVTKIEENDKFGITVEINHGGGLISVYGNMAKDGLVELGEIVSRGDTIGKIGQTSLFEFESPGHLHFEMLQNGEYTDPANYIKGL